MAIHILGVGIFQALLAHNEDDEDPVQGDEHSVIT